MKTPSLHPALDRIEALYIDEGLSASACGRALGIGYQAAVSALIDGGLQVGWLAPEGVELDPQESLRQEAAGQVNLKRETVQRVAKEKYTRVFDWTDRPVQQIAEGKRK